MHTELNKSWYSKNGTELLRRRKNLCEVHQQLFNETSLEELANACLAASYEMRFGKPFVSGLEDYPAEAEYAKSHPNI